MTTFLVMAIIAITYVIAGMLVSEWVSERWRWAYGVTPFQVLGFICVIAWPAVLLVLLAGYVAHLIVDWEDKC